jgi:hypothetical protein
VTSSSAANRQQERIRLRSGVSSGLDCSRGPTAAVHPPDQVLLMGCWQVEEEHSSHRSARRTPPEACCVVRGRTGRHRWYGRISRSGRFRSPLKHRCRHCRRCRALLDFIDESTQGLMASAVRAGGYWLRLHLRRAVERADIGAGLAGPFRCRARPQNACRLPAPEAGCRGRGSGRDAKHAGRIP